MKDYCEQTHGGDIYRHQVNIDFSVNVNPIGPRPEVIDAIKEASESIMCYPDMHCEMLIRALAKFEHVKEEMLLCGGGAAELFFAAVLAVKPKKALVLAPTFSEYERALQVVDAEITYYELKREDDFQVNEDILDQIDADLDILFVCNPNNPTGQVTKRELLQKIAKRCKECEVTLVLDECFIDFTDEPENYEFKEYLPEYPNVIIIKAFTKLFCMPGLRLGYALGGNQQLLCRMRSVMQSWNVSGPAQAGGLAALEDCAEYIQNTREIVKTERDFLVSNLRGLGYRVYGSKANYVFFEKKEGQEPMLYERALEDGFLIRDCSDYQGDYKGYYRIAVRLREDNERIIEWLKRL